MIPCIFYPNDPNNLPQQQQQQQQDRSDFHHKGSIFHNESYCDPYQVLHIRRDATRHEMKRSYQQLAVLHHPSIRSSSSMTTCRTTPSAAVTTNTTNGNGNNTHPIPVSIDNQQQQQKLFLFTIIAACYETLSVKETRQRMDHILLQQNKQKNQYQSSSPFLATTGIGQSMINRHSTIVVAATTDVGTTQFGSPKRDNRNSRTNDTNQNQRNTMIISKEEQKIRHKLQQERRIQQQERRDQKNVDTKRKKSNTKQRSHKQQQQQQQQQQTHPLLVSTGSTTSTKASSPYPHHNRQNRTDDDKDNIVDYKNVSGGDYDNDDDDDTVRQQQHQQRIERKNIRRGYDWAYHYVSSTSCGCTHSDHNHQHQHHTITSGANNNPSNTMIPYDEQSPIDRMNYQNHTNNPFRKVPITVARRNTNINANDNPYTEPPSMVRSCDSEASDDYNDDHSTDDPLSIKNIIMIDPFQQQKLATLGTQVSDTERWFGGPFRLMYRARKFEPFTDPFVLFERTFRSELVDTKRQQQLSTQESTNNRQPPEATNASKVFDTKMQQQLYLNVPPSALIALTSSNYMIPLSAADDKIETLKDGSIVTRTDRIQTAIVPQNSILYTSSIQQQRQQHIANQYQMHKTISRTITRYPPDPLSTTHQRRMTVTVTSDYEIIPIHHKNDTSKISNDYFVDCFSWITCDALSDTLQQ